MTELLAWVVRLLKGYQERSSARLRLALVLAWAALIWWESSQSGEPMSPDPIFEHIWNLAHVVVFGVLAALVLLSTQRCTVRNAVVAVAVTVAYGAADEFHQGTVDGRVTDIWDFCSDSLGACITTCTLLRLVGGSRRAGLLLLLFVPLAALSVHMASS